MVWSELNEAFAWPDRLEPVMGDMEHGVSNGQGWVYQGFIEDSRGDLRPQTYEESAFCVGCHGGIGATTDGVFSFRRKLASKSYRRGWYHWSQSGLRGLPEPKRADGRYEYSFYLKHNGAGDEYRENEEVKRRFFFPDGRPRSKMLARLHGDVSVLLNPSRERALALNKAYKLIVEDQSFALGRDPVLKPVRNVWNEVEQDLATGIEQLLPGPDGETNLAVGP